MRRLMMAIVLAATFLLAAAFGRSSAFAQSSSAYPYCLMTGPAQDCTYTSMAQCLASKRGNADFCEPNNWYSGAPGRYRSRQ
ncbi:MAG TPA: DUF3551 domain-containing protein [Xanthobacteraceae bacterium]|nr:DUF3551 domain-containing protein [Xanthobacteraceae bacterium]